MPSDRTYGPRNDAARARLGAVAATLSDADLERPLSDGWTVAIALAHLAHWDRGVLEALEGWERGSPPVFDGDADTINAAGLVRWRAMSPRAAAQEAIAAAA